MIDRSHELALASQARLLGVARSTVYREPAPVAENAAARCPPASESAKVQFRRPRATGRIARSAAELSMQARPSRNTSVKAFQRDNA
jgi:hypothetical protein